MPVASSKSAVITDITSAEAGPKIKPAMATIISFGSYFKKPATDIGKSPPRIVNIYAIAQKRPINAIFLLFFINSSFIHAMRDDIPPMANDIHPSMMIYNFCEIDFISA